jgi:hypothetical protein
MVIQTMIFHVPQEGAPDQLIPLLDAWNTSNKIFTNSKAISDFARSLGISSRTELHSMALACGLIEKDDVGAVSLTPTGKLVSCIKVDVRPEIIHYLLYTGWKDELPGNKALLWSYRTVTDHYWEQPEVNIVTDADKLTEQIRNLIQEKFGCNPSFSPKSLRGVRKWLEALTPPVIQNNIFTRRRFCSPELILLALGWAARSGGIELGVDVLLTGERRETISRLCLLESASLDRVIDWMMPLYPKIVLPGTNAGVYGRFVRFLKWPELNDLIG